MARRYNWSYTEKKSRMRFPTRATTGALEGSTFRLATLLRLKARACFFLSGREAPSQLRGLRCVATDGPHLVVLMERAKEKCAGGKPFMSKKSKKKKDKNATDGAVETNSQQANTSAEKPKLKNKDY